MTFSASTLGYYSFLDALYFNVPMEGSTVWRSIIQRTLRSAGCITKRGHVHDIEDSYTTLTTSKLGVFGFLEAFYFNDPFGRRYNGTPVIGSTVSKYAFDWYKSSREDFVESEIWSRLRGYHLISSGCRGYYKGFNRQIRKGFRTGFWASSSTSMSAIVINDLLKKDC